MNKILGLRSLVAIIASSAVSISSAASVLAGSVAYYIDYSAGSDANSGLSTNAPWKHDPYMAGFTGFYTHAAGDQHIFKGGVTWPYSCFNGEMVIRAGGTYNAQDYYGTNAAWYSGRSWSPPVFDLQMPGASSSGALLNSVNQNAILTYMSDYITFDSIVITNANWSGSTDCQTINFFTSVGIVVTNCQFLCCSNLSGTAGSGAAFQFIYGAGAAAGPSNLVTHCAFTGWPNTAYSGGAIYGGTQVTYCVFSNMPNFIVGSGFTNIAYNFMAQCQHDIDATQHENCINVLMGSATVYLHHNIESNNICGESLFMQVGTGTLNVWDNLWISNKTLAPAILPQGPTSGSGAIGTLNVWNNTFQDPYSDGLILAEAYPVTGACLAVVNCTNNFFITEQTGAAVQVQGGTTIVNQGNNIIMPNAVASADGYTCANGYRPTGASAPTVSAGVNLASFMTGLGVTALDVLGNSFPSSTNWDIGACQYRSAATGPAAWAANLQVISSP